MPNFRHAEVNTVRFSYHEAFDRNLGWLTEWEQLALRAKRVAVAGLGGAGGMHLLTLARLGVGAFTVADFDRFDLANFNRQVGATMATIGRPKAEVMEEMARAINPELRIRRFDAGIGAADIDAFLDGADLFVDGLDFFELPIRRQVFARCAELGIPAVTAAPIGMGTGFLIFTPQGMSFERYFRFAGQSENEQFLRFLVGLTPAGLSRAYLVDPTRVDLAARKGPSTAAAIQLCAGVTATMAVKLLLGRGGVKAAPWYHQYDAYRGRLVTRRLRFGNAGPLQRVKLAVGRRQFYRHAAAAVPMPAAESNRPLSEIEEILDLARWAPSGDNLQPWRFRVLDPETVTLTVRHDPAARIYEYRDGEPTWLSVGMLLETLRIAASAHRRGFVWEMAGDPAGSEIRLRFPPAPDAVPDPLMSFVTLRSVDRRAYAPRGLTAADKQALAACLDGDLMLDWHESAGARWRFGALAAAATAIRLRAVEAFAIHQRIIDWSRRHSPDRIPAAAVGLPRPMLPLMRWSMQRWERMRLLNRLGGASLTALQLDRLPAWRSAAFFVVRVGPPTPGEDPTARLMRIGGRLQRFWLTATRLGLVLQPQLAALAFAEYGASGVDFAEDAGLISRAVGVARQFQATTGRAPGEVVFLGRIGAPRADLPGARSTRLGLDRLVDVGPAADTAPADI
ncbi:MAG: ThiF family adenylyltransferase [Rhodospirillales bacterium]|nr:ThiF family adenylyltransferase [Rhodospirillales bacterium]